MTGRADRLRLAAAAVVLAGCGGAPRAAEPAVSPPIAARPAGRVIQLGGLPEGVVVDPVTGIVAVGLRDPSRIALLDAASGRMLRQVAIPGAPRHLALEGPGGPVLVPAERINALIRVALPGGRTSRTAVGAFPHDAAASGGRLLVGNEGDASVSILAGPRVVATLSRGRQPGGVAALPGGRVAVVDVRDRDLTIYRLNPPGVIASVHAGVGSTHVVAAADRIYVADTEGQAILEYQTHPALSIIGRTPAAGAPYGIAVDARRRRLWVTLTGRNQLVEYALGRNAPIETARYATIRQPDSVAVDPRGGRVFVAGRAAGQLQLIDP